MTIKTKLAVTGIALSLSTVAAGLVVLNGVEGILERNEQQDVLETAELKERVLEVYLEDTESLGDLLQSTDIVKKYVSSGGKNDAYKKGVEDLLSSIQEINWGKYHHIFLIDENRKIVLSPKHGEDVKGSPSAHLGEDASSNRWSEKAFALGTTQVSDYSSWEESDHIHQMMFYPLVDSEGVTKVVVGFELQIPYELRILSEGVTSAATEKVFLVSLDGQPIEYSISENQGVMTSPGVISALSDGDFLGITKNEQGVEVIGAYLKNDLYPWILAVEINLDEVLLDAENIQILIEISVATIAILILVLMYFFARGLLGQISQITEVAEIFASGAFGARINTGEKNELGVLAETFNNMAESIAASQRTLEYKVEQRTEDLNKSKVNLEKQQGAILNILEDIEVEKAKVSVEKDKINAILQSIGDGVFVLDKEMNIFMFNKAAENISGFDYKKVMGKKYSTILKFVYEKDGAYRGYFIEEALSRGEVRELPLYCALVKENGSQAPVAATAAPLKNKDDEVVGSVVVFRDIAKEREIDKSKSEFVSLASHQLRTPLSTINWYAEMLIAGDAGEINKEQKQYLQEIYKGNQRMVDLVNALLNVSRLELGTFIIEPEMVDLRETGKDAIGELAALLKKKNIKIEVNYDDLPKINVDRKLTHIIFQNLLSNAVKYSPDEGVVSLSITKGEHDVDIKVSDSGIGIPKEQQDKMFSKLFRANNAKASDTTGTGLGLYIVKSILDHSGGKISFESEEGKGTTFHVSIPLKGMEKKKGNKSLD